MNLMWSNVTIQLKEVSVIFNLKNKNWIPRRTFLQSLDAIFLENK